VFRKPDNDFSSATVHSFTFHKVHCDTKRALAALLLPGDSWAIRQGAAVSLGSGSNVTETTVSWPQQADPTAHLRWKKIHCPEVTFFSKNSFLLAE